MFGRNGKDTRSTRPVSLNPNGLCTQLGVNASSTDLRKSSKDRGDQMLPRWTSPHEEEQDDHPMSYNISARLPATACWLEGRIGIVVSRETAARSNQKVSPSRISVKPSQLRLMMRGSSR